MKSSSPKRRIRPIHARAATADPSTLDDYGPEPNMKLSHAFIVVLALHVVAVGGLFAFNKVKAHHALSAVKVKTETLQASSAAVSQAMTASHPAGVTTAPLHAPSADMVAQTAPVAPPTSVPPTPAGIPGNQVTPPVASSAPVVAPTPQPVAVAETAPTAPLTESVVASPLPAVASSEYTVVKGDNPYKIAKRFHVTYDGLMKLNNITDPRKIQIGQKLKIPAATPHKKTKHK